MFLYKQACIRRLPLFSSRQVDQDLTHLNHGENIQWIRTEYYVKKVSLVLGILTAAVLLGAGAKLSAWGVGSREDGGSFVRGDYADGETQIQVTARLADGEQEFQITLAPKTLSSEELDHLAEDFLDRLPELIAGKNQGLSCVTEDMELLDAYPGYPFEVSWSSDRPDVVSGTGRVVQGAEKEEVCLRAEISFEGYERETAYQVTVLPMEMTAEEKRHAELEEMLLLSEEESRCEEVWTLPDEWEGEPIVWKRKKEDKSLLLWGMGIVAAALIYLMSDRDLHRKLEQRQDRLRRAYPDLVHQLALFVGAGMTVRGAFQRVAADYEKKRDGSAEILPVCEEMLITCRELSSGVSEGAAYEHFGRRTGRQEYVRLSALLMQNVKRGNSALLERLKEEADKAAEEQLMQNRKLGEEAGTKLLVPMIMMLGVVMVMIMVPAFSSL